MLEFSQWVNQYGTLVKTITRNGSYRGCIRCVEGTMHYCYKGQCYYISRFQDAESYIIHLEHMGVFSEPPFKI